MHKVFKIKDLNKYISSVDPERHIIVYPTDTIYGVGGDPLNQIIVSRVLYLKKRVLNPFPILISKVDYVYKLAYVSVLAEKFIEYFWPGGLTILFKAKYDVPAILGSKVVGLRCPAPEKLRELIEYFGGLLIGTSANISGYSPATSYLDAYNYFGDRVDYYIVDDDMPHGKPSTVLDLSGGDVVKIIRVGYVGLDELSRICGEWGCKLVVKSR